MIRHHAIEIMARTWPTWVFAARQRDSPQTLSLPLLEALPQEQSASPMNASRNHSIGRVCTYATRACLIVIGLRINWAVPAVW